jgi:serine/threonine-protein kinase
MWLSDRTLEHLRAVTDAPDMSGTRYRILELIGSGGMGAVYLADDTSLQREVAVKVLRTPEIHADIARRMIDEARILARLEHPGIVPIYDAGQLADGRVYYAMKLVRGQRLDQIVTPDMPLNERLRVFRRICEPVAFAHAHHVVHRDLKPENIMVGSFGEVLVMDWGVAKQADRNAVVPNGPDDACSLDGATLHGTRLGTPGWMSPEQERGDIDRIDARTDIYGLGAILRFLLGAAPAVEETPAFRRAPRPLRAMCALAMRVDPERRYASANLFATDIDRFLAGDPVTAYREPVWERAARFYRKYRTAILLIVTYLIMRALLLAFSGR